MFSLLFYESYVIIGDFHRRVGVDQTSNKNAIILPATIDELQQQFDTIERERLAPEWDYIWNTSIEESREKRLKHHVFSRYPAPLPFTSIPKETEIAIAECAVKAGIISIFYLCHAHSEYR